MTEFPWSRGNKSLTPAQARLHLIPAISITPPRTKCLRKIGIAVAGLALISDTPASGEALLGNALPRLWLRCLSRRSPRRFGRVLLLHSVQGHRRVFGASR